MASIMFRKNNSNTYEEWDIPDTSSLPPDELVKLETAIHVKKAIHNLPESQKEAIVLREYHQLNYNEISEILGCSLEQVKILIFRGRERLRVELLSITTEGSDGWTNP